MLRFLIAAREEVTSTQLRDDLLSGGRPPVCPSRQHAHAPPHLPSQEYLNNADPSVLRFLIAAREEVTSTQLRDDLLSMLVAGHETTGSVLTWTAYLLATHPEKMAKAQVCS